MMTECQWRQGLWCARWREPEGQWIPVTLAYL